MKFEVQLSGQSGPVQRPISRTVELERSNSGWSVSLDGQPLDADIVEIAPHTLSILLHGRSHEIRLFPAPDGTLQIHDGLQHFAAEVIDPRSWRGRRHAGPEVEGRQQVTAPMPGKIVRVLVKAGERVESGQGLIVVEAMKMQNEIRSPKSGTIERVFAVEGQTVSAGEPLVWVD
jgi:biotin carboxyl carrier protein